MRYQNSLEFLKQSKTKLKLKNAVKLPLNQNQNLQRFERKINELT